MVQCNLGQFNKRRRNVLKTKWLKDIKKRCLYKATDISLGRTLQRWCLLCRTIPLSYIEPCNRITYYQIICLCVPNGFLLEGVLSTLLQSCQWYCWLSYMYGKGAATHQRFDHSPWVVSRNRHRAIQYSSSQLVYHFGIWLVFSPLYAWDHICCHHPIVGHSELQVATFHSITYLAMRKKNIYIRFMKNYIHLKISFLPELVRTTISNVQGVWFSK